jgi:hypothetical protein
MGLLLIDSSFVHVMSDYCCCEREVLWEREHSRIVRSSTGCEDQPCNWVRREGREEKRKKERDLQAKSR